MIDLTKALTTSNSSSLKLFAEGTGTLTTPSGFNQTQTVTIPHNYGSNELLWEVGIEGTGYYINNNFYTPFYTSDDRINAYSTLDANNIYITIRTSSGGTAVPAVDWKYRYRILIP